MSTTTQQLKPNAITRIKESSAEHPDELIAFCPKCKTLETLWFIGEVLVHTRKFAQSGEHVFHDCGSEQPCRLLPRFLNRDKSSNKLHAQELPGQSHSITPHKGSELSSSDRLNVKSS